jgi:hypothetical protein
MLVEQERDGTVWSPSKMIWRFGKEVSREEVGGGARGHHVYTIVGVL